MISGAPIRAVWLARNGHDRVAPGNLAVDTILVCNAGSSSVKFQVFGINGGVCARGSWKSWPGWAVHCTLDPAANERGPVDIESRGPPRYTYRADRRGTDNRAPHLGAAFDARRPLDSLVNRWTNGFAEGSVGPRPRAINLIAVWTG